MIHRLFNITEGKVLYIGLVLSLLLLIVIGYFAIVDIEIAEILGLVFFVHTIGGRAAGIGLCIMNGFGPAATIWYNFYIEVLILCFTYSIFALTTNKYF